MNKRQAKKFYHKQLLQEYVKAKFWYNARKEQLNSIYGLQNGSFVPAYDPKLLHAYSKLIIKRRAYKRFIDRIEALYPRETRKLKRKGYV